MEKKEATNWKEEKLLLDAKDLQRILRINRNHIYELFHQSTFPSISIGKRYVIEKNNFKKWLQLQSWENEFTSKHNTLSNNDKKLYKEVFWQAVSFLKDREADDIDRTGKVTELFSKT